MSHPRAKAFLAAEGERTVPRFVDMDGVSVHAERLCAELDNYASDIRRGTIHPTLPFAAYVEYYCGWTLTPTPDAQGGAS